MRKHPRLLVCSATLRSLTLILACLLLGACGPSVESAIEILPQDATYSDPAGIGGMYKDPIYGFFEVEVPEEWTVRVRRDKTRLRLPPDGPEKGLSVRRSWVQFSSGTAEIAAIARETRSDLDEDFEFSLQGFRGIGAKILSTRSVTIDGAKGREAVLSIRGHWHLNIKYKKGGLDHSLSLGAPSRDFLSHLPGFVAFAHSYRSLADE